MISGTLLLDREFDKKKYIKRLLKYVILIVVWDIIYLVWEYFYLGITYNKLYRLLFDPYRAHLWFLYSIILLYALQPLLRIILNKSNKTVKMVLLSLWIIFSILSLFNLKIASIFTIFDYIGYFVIGKYLYDYSKKIDYKNNNVFLIIAVIVCLLFSIILDYHSSIKYEMFYNLYFAYRSLFIIIASFAFYTLIIRSYKKEGMNKTILFLSDLSLGVYLLHGIFLDITKEIFDYYLINPLWGIPLFTIIILVCTCITLFFLRKIKIIQKIT